MDRDAWRNNHLERSYAHRSAGHEVFVLDADSGATLARMDTDQVPISLAFDAAAQRLYVTNRGGVRVEQGQGSLTVYDTRAYRRLQTLPLPPHPNSLALDPATGAVYVSIKNGRDDPAGSAESVARISFFD